MKKVKLLSYLVILISGFMFLQCTSDKPIYAPGLDGADGVDGVDGIDGVGVAECVACHNNEHREPIEASFDLSGHFLGTHTGGNYGSRESCAQCHSNDGYVDLQERGFVQPGGYYSFGPPQYVIDDNDTPDDPTDDFLVIDDDPDSPTFGLPLIENESFNNSAKIRCTTCHGSHSTFDFENDGNDMALRQGFRPVNLFYDPSISIDLGISNTCVNCHQPRNSYVVPGPVDDYTNSSSRFGPHHGPQSTVLFGILGAEVSGSVPYPAAGSNGHVAVSCTGCHMGETTDGSDGAHSFIPTGNSCAECHAIDIENLEIANFESDMATLKSGLIDLGVLQENDRPIPGTYPANVAQALWNYRTLLEDQSNGIHNPEYAKALLTNSIEALGD